MLCSESTHTGEFILGLRFPHKEVTTSSQGAKKTPFLETTNVKLESEGQLSLAQGRQSSRTGHAGSDQDWDFHADTVHRDSGLVCDQPLGGSSASQWCGEKEASKEPKKP